MTLVVDGAQSNKNVVYGQSTFAHETVDGTVFTLFRIADTHMLNICAQIADGLVGGLIVEIVGVVEIPQGGQIVVGESVQHLADAGGVGINTCGLNEQNDICLYGGGQQLPDNGDDALLVLVGNKIHTQTYIGYLQQTCQMDAAARLGKHAFYRALANINRDAGAFQIGFVKGSYELSAVGAGVCALQQGSGLYLGIEQLNTAHFHFGSLLAGIAPRNIRPSACIKTQFHLAFSS